MINITGASEGRIAPIIAEIIKEKKGQSLIVVSTFNRAKRLACDLSFFDARNIYILPADEESMIQYDAKSNEELLHFLALCNLPCQGVLPAATS